MRDHFGLKGLISGNFGLESLTRGHVSLHSLIIAQFGSGPKPGKLMLNLMLSLYLMLMLN